MNLLFIRRWFQFSKILFHVWLIARFWCRYEDWWNRLNFVNTRFFAPPISEKLILGQTLMENEWMHLWVIGVNLLLAFCAVYTWWYFDMDHVQGALNEVEKDSCVMGILLYDTRVVMVTEAVVWRTHRLCQWMLGTFTDHFEHLLKG